MHMLYHITKGIY